MSVRDLGAWLSQCSRRAGRSHASSGLRPRLPGP